MASPIAAASSLAMSRFLLIMLFLVGSSVSSTQFSYNFYENSCPEALSIVKSTVNSAVKNESRMGASLLRLHFHDCFVNASGITLPNENVHVRVHVIRWHRGWL